jgi:CubicO group peptidase (beta-lactamase class C family)
MLLNRGSLHGIRILSENSVRFMTSDHLPADVNFGDNIAAFGSVGPVPWMGQSFGLGVVIRTSNRRNPDMGFIGDFYWPGISGTSFWVDPARNLVTVLMLQSPAARARYRSPIRNLVYQALVN